MTGRLVDVPVDVDGATARELARRELADPAYHIDDPSLLERVIAWIIDQLVELVAQAAAASPGGWLGLAVLLGLLVLAAIVIRLRTGPLARAARFATPLFEDQLTSAEEHRRLADAVAAAGDYSAAVVARFRAVIRSLEERGLLDVRPGRTADEAAREAGAQLPDRAAALTAAAATFDDVRYGDHPATAADDEALRQLDATLATATPVG